MALSPCPPRERLLLLLDERLPAAEAETLTSHTDVCPTCQQILEELTAGAADLRARLRRGLEDQTDQTPPVPDLPPRQQLTLPEVAGYEVLGVLGRGGEGIVYRARHRALGRLVALKLVRGGGPQQLQRFRQEAELLARLSHPNIVRIYEVGEHEGLPFFALEHIAGGSLGQRLTGQPLPAALAAALVEAVARAVHAAHRAGVVHRDLKPANILLYSAEGESPAQWRETEEGSAPLAQAEAVLRELQGATPKVSDFGLAKAVRVGDELTATGAVLGTPEYMAPEQAQGQGRQAGPACDVYSLGAVLYQVLTGRPPFVGERAMEVMLQVVQAEPLPPRRLNPAVPRDLETVCLKCLEKEPGRRYGTAEELADDLGRFLRGEPVRARPVGLLGRGVRWARRRPAAAALMATVLLLVVGLAVGGLWLQGLAGQRRLGVESALKEAEGLREKGRWTEALTVLEQAQRGLGEGALLRRMEEKLRWQLEEALRHLRLVRRLDDIRARAVTAVAEGQMKSSEADEEYKEAFQEVGLATVGQPAEEVAQRVRDSPVRGALVAALDDWVVRTQDGKRREWLLAVARQADPDSGSGPVGWGERFRNPEVWRDRAALQQLADQADVKQLSPQTLYTLSAVLRGQGGDGLRLMRAALDQHPTDYWLALQMGATLAQANRLEEAAWACRVALASRPDSAAAYNNLGAVLGKQGKLDEAVACCRRAVELDPEYARGHNNLGNGLKEQGKLDEAIVSYRKAIELDPKDALAHTNLGAALREQGKLEEAITSLEQALVLDPKLVLAHDNLGFVRMRQRKWDEAIASWRRILELRPRSASVYTNIGVVLEQQGKWDEAIASYREATRSDPKEAKVHYNLGLALLKRRRWEEAIVSFRRVLSLNPKIAPAHTNLGIALEAQGNLDEAMACYRQAIELNPKDIKAHGNLGLALARERKLEEAVASYRRVLAVDPENAGAHCNLSFVLRDLGRFPEALAAVQRGHELGSKSPGWRFPSADWGRTAQQLVDLEARLPEVLAGKARPADNEERLLYAWLCARTKRFVAAAGLYVEAFAAQPEREAKHLYNAACAAGQAGCGRGDGAKLGEAERLRWRRQALTWLRADLEAFANRVGSGEGADRDLGGLPLRNWSRDPDLAGLREPVELARLPAEERAAWALLWVDVEVVSKKAQVKE